MLSKKSEFKYLDRGFRDSVVLIPGWASDYRIFSRLNLDYNYLLPVKFYPFGFKEALSQELKRINLEKTALFGWSLGAFLAVEFALENQAKVSELILLGIRKRYKANETEKVRRQLRKNKMAYLYKFYLSCFSDKDKEGVAWFRKHLLKDYCNMGLESLECGLDYLESREIQQGVLKDMKNIIILHGEDDVIAPIKEARQINPGLSKAKFISLSGLGHIPFLSPEFSHPSHLPTFPPTRCDNVVQIVAPRRWEGGKGGKRKINDG